MRHQGKTRNLRNITVNLEKQVQGTLYYKSVCMYKRSVAPLGERPAAATPSRCKRPSAELNKLQKKSAGF